MKRLTKYVKILLVMITLVCVFFSILNFFPQEEAKECEV